MTDPIHRRTTPDVGRAAEAGQVSAGQAAPAAPKFQVGGPATPTPPPALPRPNFERIAARVEQLRQGSNPPLTRDQVRERVIGEETRDLFGRSATPAMAAAVDNAFRNDPQLAHLFNQLYNKAIAQPKS